MIPSKPIVLHVDPEHAGIRTLIVPILVLSLVFSYFVMRAVLDAVMETDAGPVLNCLAGLVLGLAIAAAGEWLMKRYWKSGKRVVVDLEGIHFRDKNKQVVTMRQDKPIYTLKWYFDLSSYHRAGRERRLPSKWKCFACQLMQDDKRLILFTFLSPRQADRLEERRDFNKINPDEVYDTSLRNKVVRSLDRPVISSRILAGKNGRYWSSEQRRWKEGMELTGDDFLVLAEVIEANEESN